MKTTAFNDYLDFLISAEGRKDYFSCTTDEKEELTAHYIAQNPLDHEAWLMESKDYDVIVRLLQKYMITADADLKEIMVDKMKAIAVDYFYERIAAEFDFEIRTRHESLMQEHDMVSMTHKDNGETYWVHR